MTTYKEVKISRILNPTSIDLGEYVINPYMGCEYACLYCYVRSNRVISKRPGEWGTYVDIRVNAPHLLEKEILLKKPKYVLLGSTTDCFQPIEKKYRITQNILEILNRYQVFYNILTRSPYITEYTDLLKKGFCKKIYFTINNLAPELKTKLEPKSPSYETRFQAINKLLDENIDVIPYFSPILPWVSILTPSPFPSSFAKASEDRLPIGERVRVRGDIEFEGLNFNLVNINDIIDTIAKFQPSLRDGYIKLKTDRYFYESFWAEIKKDIIANAIKRKKHYNIYIHNFGSYFNNRYEK